MEFETYRENCLNMLDDLAAVADSQIVDRIEAARQRLSQEKLKILVVGEFSRGKSTFINALIGSPILPSKVNPTTATINIISGGDVRQASIEYIDGRIESLDLPSEGINKFLDSLVTTSNEKAASIRVVRIQIPGRLETLQADIVDTPGVNDLDQAREEITFRYLREADAAVMLLDAQQPLSESERIFLHDKVFGADVNRTLFVINKADEVLLSGNVNDIERLREYVTKRLQDLLNISSPEVFAISSKNALRARFKHEADPTSVSFEHFERRLVEFAGIQATKGRLQTHLERIEGLITLQVELIEQKLKALEMDIEDLDSHLIDLEKGIKVMAERVLQLHKRIENAMKQLGDKITELSRGRIQAMRSDLTSKLNSCINNDDLESIRGELARSLRDLVACIEEDAKTERDQLARMIEVEFAGVLDSLSCLLPMQSHALVEYNQYAVISSVDNGITSIRGQETEFDIKTAAISAGIGYIGASLFGGPIGITAAVVGGFLFSKYKGEQREAELARLERERMIQALHEACRQMSERAESAGRDIAQRECADLAESLRERAQRRQTTLTASIEATKESRLQSKDEKKYRAESLRERLRLIKSLEITSKSLKESANA